ncbi:hypothetical protein [Streptomyces sp. HB2AG]|uniref:hypothetical protein n=1 Tax=Streptomyces sp. HB2AG TaxID=2983400 RepID=UPI0022AA615D|nr:hypothetical protein [Streptomyces sp. HB2AG]MCZ2528031.1 hypothetical protein [Streptomyces sp. HB2AG]
MARSRTARALPAPAVRGLLVQTLVLALLALAAFACVRLHPGSGNSTGPEAALRASAPVAVSLQDLTRTAVEASTKIPAAEGVGTEGADTRTSANCSKKPGATEGPSNPRWAGSDTAHPAAAEPCPSRPAPVRHHVTGHIGPAPPAPDLTRLSVLRI